MVFDWAFSSAEVGAVTIYGRLDPRRPQAYGDGGLLTDFDFQVVHLFRVETGPVDPNRVDAGDHGSEEERPIAGGLGTANPPLGGFCQRDRGSANAPSAASRTVPRKAPTPKTDCAATMLQPSSSNAAIPRAADVSNIICRKYDQDKSLQYPERILRTAERKGAALRLKLILRRLRTGSYNSCAFADLAAIERLRRWMPFCC